MDRNELVDRCKAIIKEAYEEATEMIVAYLELHPGEQLQPLAKEIDPENWNALRNRVQRAQEARKASAVAKKPRAISVMTEHGGATKRNARQVLSKATPEEIAEEILSDPKIAANVAKAAVVSEQQKQHGEKMRQKKDAPALVHRFGFSDVVGELFKAKRSYATALNAIRELDLDTEEIEAITELVGEIDLVREWFQSFLDSGSSDFDTELEKLLAEGV